MRLATFVSFWLIRFWFIRIQYSIQLVAKLCELRNQGRICFWYRNLVFLLQIVLASRHPADTQAATYFVKDGNL